MTGVGRGARLAALTLSVALVLVACGPTGAAPSVVPSPTFPAASSPAPTPTATPDPLAAGEPWLLYTWWLADGQRVAYLARPDGTGMRRILADVHGDIRAPVWSPDGQRIAFVVKNETWPDGAIWSSNADGTDAALFYDGKDAGCDSVFHPTWSPDGSKMAMICYRDTVRAADLAVLDVASMQLSEIETVTWPEFLDGPASWSSDGRSLAFSILHWDPTDTHLDGSLVAVVAADGSSLAQRLTDMASFASSPEWSPDDQDLVFNNYDLGNMHEWPGASNLFRIAASGGEPEQLTTEPPGSSLRVVQPQWDPDGTRIWVTVELEEDYSLAWVDPSTGELHTLPIKGAGPKPRS